ncbi:hypothetical protein MRX96_007616 [Rhipicephalus microplus]
MAPPQNRKRPKPSPSTHKGSGHAGGLVKPNRTIMFDHVVGEDKKDKYIFEHTNKEMLTTLLDGCNCSLFAYGATGAGKTFTMLGSEECPRVVSLTAIELYRHVDKRRSEGHSCDVAVTYLEV